MKCHNHRCGTADLCYCRILLSYHLPHLRYKIRRFLPDMRTDIESFCKSSTSSSATLLSILCGAASISSGRPVKSTTAESIRLKALFKNILFFLLSIYLPSFTVLNQYKYKSDTFLYSALQYRAYRILPPDPSAYRLSQHLPSSSLRLSEFPFCNIP